MTTDPPVLVRLSDTDLTLASEADDVRGRQAVDRNGDEIGEVDDLILDPDERRVRFLQVGAGGFLGLGEQKQLIPVDAVSGVDDDAVHVDKDRELIAAAPAYDPDLVRQPDYESLYGHYGYTPFWTAGYVYPPYPYHR